MDILAAAVVWLLLGCVTGGIAWSRGHSFPGWWLFGLLFFPLALPMALTLPRNVPVLDRRREAEGQWKRCPSCAEFVRQAAVVCRSCGRDIPTGGSEAVVASLLAAAPRRPPAARP